MRAAAGNIPPANDVFPDWAALGLGRHTGARAASDSGRGDGALSQRTGGGPARPFAAIAKR